MTKISLMDLKQRTGVGFGTSGIRAKNEELTDMVVYVYTQAFLKHVGKAEKVVLAGDLRQSTDKIMVAAGKAVKDLGIELINGGKIPTPALCYFGFQNNWPSIMVTGSHIPEDRNGVKFQMPNREVLKTDEVAITSSLVEVDESLFDISGNFVDDFKSELPQVSNQPKDWYIKRYLDFFEADLFAGKTLGLYGHSAVGRDIYDEILQKLGAKVVKIDFSNSFVPIDTETVDPELIKKGELWRKEHNLDLILSTDGDGDRPLLADENGVWLRSEILPIFTAKYLGITQLATILQSNTAAEKTGWFKKITRSKIGSPYVVAGMEELINNGGTSVAGYEANGGFMLGSEIGSLKPLPTRDALISLLAVPALAKRENKKISKLLEELPTRFTYSLSIKGIPTERSLDVLEKWQTYKTEIENTFGKIANVNQVDGLRLTFENEDIVHFRPSKNSPEFRNYTESDTEEKAKELAEKAIGLMTRFSSAS